MSEQRYLVTRLRNELDQERPLARTDPLTSIANIRSFRAELERSIERLSRYGRHFTLISIDLDNFKPINHDYGHAEGGKVLKDVGDTLRSGLRSGNFPARIGATNLRCCFLIRISTRPGSLSRAWSRPWRTR
ncbi:GGDEF domain-containing protein [Marinobacter sp. JB05H06]|nr:GGDEF domain-containing protein [Marinobacter sp. JB05H06]